MKYLFFLTTVGLGAVVLFGAGCSGRGMGGFSVKETPTVSIAPTAERLEPGKGIDLEDRVSAMRGSAPLLVDATSTDALQGPLALVPNRAFIVAVASESVQTWIEGKDISSIAMPNNVCIGKEYQSSTAFREKLLSKFKPEDRVYVYQFAPDPKKNPPDNSNWDITIIPNRFGYTSVRQINDAFAWIGGCEAGMVGLYGFNKNWIAYGDGCHESGGPSSERGCHMSIEALGKLLKLR